MATSPSYDWKGLDLRRPDTERGSAGRTSGPPPETPRRKFALKFMNRINEENGLLYA